MKENKLFVQLDRSSQPVEYKNVITTYQKGDLFCIAYINKDDEKWVDKYPIQNIFRTRQTFYYINPTCFDLL